MDAPHPDRGGRGLLAAALVLLAFGCLVQAARGYSSTDLSGHAEGTDDAYISYRYARNLIDGHGLVFNPGERVEGYSNLLYVLLMAPAIRFGGPDRVFAVSVGLNLLFAAIALLQLFGFARERLGGPRAGLAALLFALCPSLWVAVASGLETPLVLCLQVGIWIAAERVARDGGGRQAGLLAGLSVLSVLARADGFLTPSLAVLFLVLRGRRQAALAVAAVSGATLAAVIAWRLSYYGWPLPNTYYAKVAGPPLARIGAGLKQLSIVLFDTGLWLHVVALLWLLRRWVRGEAGRLPFSLLFSLAWIGYWVYVGGDVFHDRFLLALFPMGAFVLLALAPKEVSVRTLAAIAAAVALVQLAQMTDERFHYRSEHYDRWVLLGRFLARAHPGATLAIDAAGKVPYVSGLRTIDMLGLTDAHIAHLEPAPGRLVVGHSKHDAAYVLARRPDLIAAWVRDDFLNLEYGIRRKAYGKAGYELRYLVNAEPESQEPNLLDVSGLEREDIAVRLAKGYRYGVLAKLPAIPHQPHGSP